MNRTHCLLVLTAWLVLAGPVSAQDKIYRCGNEYTNNPGDAKARGCRLIEGGNLTIVEGLKPQAASNKADAPRPKGSSASGARSDAERVDSAEQRARDSDARAILEAELRKAETRLAELRTEFNNGEPEKRGPEFRNHQLYLDRVNDIKVQLARAESDVAGLKRELSRTSAR